MVALRARPGFIALYATQEGARAVRGGALFSTPRRSWPHTRAPTVSRGCRLCTTIRTLLQHMQTRASCAQAELAHALARVRAREWGLMLTRAHMCLLQNNRSRPVRDTARTKYEQYMVPSMLGPKASARPPPWQDARERAWLARAARVPLGLPTSGRTVLANRLAEGSTDIREGDRCSEACGWRQHREQGGK